MTRIVKMILTLALSAVIIFSVFLFGSTTRCVQAATSVKVQMRNSNILSSTNQIGAIFKLYNDGSEAVDLADIKIRYYYTINGDKDQNFFCDYAAVGLEGVPVTVTPNVTGTFTKMTSAASDADYYLEVGFNSSAGALAAGTSAEIHWRFAKSDWSNYSQTDDYSFGTSTLTDSPQTPVYYLKNVTLLLIYGAEPDTTAPTITHTAVSFAEANVAIPIAATITDASSVTARVYYGASANGSGFTDYVTMTNTSGSSFTANIPGADAGSLYYYIQAADSKGNTATSPSDITACNRITISPSLIHNIKISFYAGQVRTIDGIVTCVDGSYYYIQEPDSDVDGDPSTPEGMAVYYSGGSLGWNPGDLVTVKGTITLNGSRLILVAASSSDTSKDTSGNPLPDPQDNIIPSIGNNCEGMRLKLQNVTIGAVDTGANTPLYDQDDNTINIYHVPALAAIAAGDRVNVTAIAVGGTPFYLIVGSASDVTRLAGDTTSPAITANTPSGTGVSISTPSISLTFDELVKAASGKEISVSDGNNTFMADAGTVLGTSWVGKTAAIPLTSFKDSGSNSFSLDYGTVYSVNIPAGAFTDIAGLGTPLTTRTFTVELDPLTPSATPLSLTINKGGTCTINVSLGQGTSAASTASISSLAPGILSAVPATLTSNGTITVSGLSVGTSDVRITFNDPLNTIVTVNVTVSAVPPVWPANSRLTAAGTARSDTTLNWTTAQDTAGVNGYRVYQNASMIAAVAGNVFNYTVSGLAEHTAYTFRIQAGNTDGVWTSDGPGVTVTTLSSGGDSSSTKFYTISSQAGEGGRISVASTRVALNSITSFTVAPDSGYQISDVWVNGVTVGPVSSYELNNITSNIFVKAFFKKMPVSWSNPFVDVAEKDWFYEAVAYASQNGLFHGTGPNLFSPDKGMTRAMFVTVLANMDHADISQASGDFVDVAPGAWYAGSIAWASQKGIVGGVGQNRFAPDQVITRQEMITILYNYAKLTGLDVSNAEDMVISEYSDNSNISDWAITAMRWAIHEGVIFGKHGNVLDPQGTATRAETAVVLQRLSIRYGMTIHH